MIVRLFGTKLGKNILKLHKNVETVVSYFFAIEFIRFIKLDTNKKNYSEAGGFPFKVDESSAPLFSLGLLFEAAEVPFPSGCACEEINGVIFVCTSFRIDK